MLIWTNLIIFLLILYLFQYLKIPHSLLIGHILFNFLLLVDYTIL